MSSQTEPAEPGINVSAVIPAFNVRQTILRAIDSVLAQQGHDLEVVVVDDCSTDGTLELVQTTYAGDPRVRAVQAETNGGPSRARNLAIQLARGTWVGLLDGDDVWLPSRLDRLLEKAGNADFIADNLLGYDAAAEAATGRFYRATIESDAIGLADLMAPPFNFDLATLKPLMRRSFILEKRLNYPEHVRYGEDLLFYANALSAGARFGVIPDPLYLYTTPVGKLSGTASPHSRTVQYGTLLASELEKLARQPKLTPADRRAIRARAGHVRRNPNLRDFITHAQSRNLPGMIATVARHPGLVIDIFDKLGAMREARKAARDA